MSLQAVQPTLGDLVRENKPKRQVTFRYDWAVSMTECGRAYFARVNESLVLNAHKRPGSRTWEYVVIGFDLTQPDPKPLMLELGTTDTLTEAKYRAEQKIPNNTPTMKPTLWDDEVPF